MSLADDMKNLSISSHKKEISKNFDMIIDLIKEQASKGNDRLVFTPSQRNISDKLYDEELKNKFFANGFTCMLDLDSTLWKIYWNL